MSPQKKRSYKNSVAVVETEVRRSPRLQKSSKGFKLSSCSDSKCLACRSKPLILKKEVIRKLAINFCNLKETEVSDDLLQKKRARTHPITRAKIVPVLPTNSQVAGDEQEEHEQEEHAREEGRTVEDENQDH